MESIVDPFAASLADHDVLGTELRQVARDLRLMGVQCIDELTDTKTVIEAQQREYAQARGVGKRLQEVINM